MYKGKLLTGAVLSVFMAGAYGNASAADGTSDAVYSLNPVVVTATRYPALLHQLFQLLIFH